MVVAVTGWMGWVEGKKVAESNDNFLTQSHVKERNEKHQKRKKERKDQILLVYYGTYSLFTFVIYQ